MPEPKWPSRQMLDLIDQDLVTEHGGAHGVRAAGGVLIESARARQRYAYAPDSDLAALGAAYLFCLVENHGCLDGNKRVAFAAAATFLLLNGVRLTASEVEACQWPREL
jgi:death on curing protein